MSVMPSETPETHSERVQRQDTEDIEAMEGELEALHAELRVEQEAREAQEAEAKGLMIRVQALQAAARVSESGVSADKVLAFAGRFEYFLATGDVRSPACSKEDIEP